ncbi:MAG: hypothetical protein ACOC3T_02215 [Bacteroidota bacterium]
MRHIGKLFYTTFLFFVFTGTQLSGQELREDRKVNLGITPLKPFFKNELRASILTHRNKTHSWGTNITFYRIFKNYTPSEIVFYDPEDYGFRLYVHIRMHSATYNLQGFYTQLNFGGGLFSQMVSYANQADSYTIYEKISRRENFMALGGMVEGGYQYTAGKISMNVSLGYQCLPRILPKRINHNGQEYTLYKAGTSEFSDNHLWYRNGPGKMIDLSFTVYYNF